MEDALGPFRFDVRYGPAEMNAVLVVGTEMNVGARHVYAQVIERVGLKRCVDDRRVRGVGARHVEERGRRRGDIHVRIYRPHHQTVRPGMDSFSYSFFDRPTTTVARDLLGRWLIHHHPTAGRLVGRIVETEAYTEDDPACHASHLSRDPETGTVTGQGRGRDLFAAPGTAYVYLIYGMHWLLNVVTEPEGTAGAVLIRAVEPVSGIDFMEEARGVRRQVDLTNGPGKLTDAIDVDEAHHQTDLTAPPLYFAEGHPVSEEEVEQSSRIGISKAVERPWRWFVSSNRFVSNGTPSGA